MKSKFLLISAFILLVSSCSERLEEQRLSELDNLWVSKKIVKFSDSYLPNTFSVKFETVPSEEQLKELESEGVNYIKRAFPSTPGKEEVEAKYGLDRWYEVGLEDEALLDSKVLSFAGRPEVAAVEYNPLIEKHGDGKVTPVDLTKAGGNDGFNDPYFSYQWGLFNTGGTNLAPNAVKGADINVKDVWSALDIAGDPSIIVAVIDEGVKYTHPDLAANMWNNPGEIQGNGVDDDGNGYVDDYYGYNFVSDGPIEWTLDGNSGHGTHCAGVIAAVNNNNIGICGVAGGSGKNDGCRIMSCQIFSGEAGGSDLQTARAIKYAADMGASVISCSFGYTNSFTSDNIYYKTSSVEIDAVHYFEDAANANNPVINGNIAVFSSGNEAHNYAHYPGAFVDVISVSALGPDMLPANYTNYGPGCNIAAPGGELGRVNSFRSEILSTVTREAVQNGFGDNNPYGKGFDYGYMHGTSMACPHVSGVVALGLSYAKKIGKTFDRDEFKQMVLASTKDIDQRISKTESKSYVKVFLNGGNQYYVPSADLKLAPYYHQMGTGLIDAWQLMMNIEGIPSLFATIGKTDYIDLSPYFGSSSVSLTYLDVEVPEATKNSLGLEEIQSSNNARYPAVPEKGFAYVQFGRLYIHPTKAGSGKIIIHAIGGGDHLGGGDNPPGGMEIVQEISIVSRDVKSDNGGWL